MGSKGKEKERKLNKSPILSNDLFCQAVFMYFYINNRNTLIYKYHRFTDNSKRNGNSCESGYIYIF